MLIDTEQLVDAFIGSTAVAYGVPLLTGSDKHYKMVKEIQVIKFVP